jgi:hypothetical protein
MQNNLDIKPLYHSKLSKYQTRDLDDDSKIRFKVNLSDYLGDHSDETPGSNIVYNK